MHSVEAQCGLGISELIFREEALTPPEHQRRQPGKACGTTSTAIVTAIVTVGTAVVAVGTTVVAAVVTGRFTVVICSGRSGRKHLKASTNLI